MIRGKRFVPLNRVAWHITSSAKCCRQSSGQKILNGCYGTIDESYFTRIKWCLHVWFTCMVIEIKHPIIIQKQVREWCLMPYPGHPKGCPNYGNKNHPDCPPHSSIITDFMDLSKPHWLIVVSFDLAAHVRALSKKHPQWSDRQCRCCLYWQGTPRSQLRKEAQAFSMSKPGTVSTLCPEGRGVNIFRTCHQHGLTIRKNPKDIVYKIALVGYRKERNKTCQCC